jgi:hypothetical protein
MSIYGWFYFVHVVIDDNNFDLWNTFHCILLNNEKKNCQQIIVCFNIECWKIQYSCEHFNWWSMVFLNCMY